jgi:hypothetical protein
MKKALMWVALAYLALVFMYFISYVFHADNLVPYSPYIKGAPITFGVPLAVLLYLLTAPVTTKALKVWHWIIGVLLVLCILAAALGSLTGAWGWTLFAIGFGIPVIIISVFCSVIARGVSAYRNKRSNIDK